MEILCGSYRFNKAVSQPHGNLFPIKFICRDLLLRCSYYKGWGDTNIADLHYTVQHSTMNKIFQSFPKSVWSNCWEHEYTNKLLWGKREWTYSYSTVIGHMHTLTLWWIGDNRLLQRGKLPCIYCGARELRQLLKSSWSTICSHSRLLHGNLLVHVSR